MNYLDKELEYLSLPVRYEVESTSDDRFKKIKIYVMHDKKNLNNSYFDMTIIDTAKESIKNIPILAFVKSVDGTNESDFGGHEFEIAITDGDLKFKYLGRPIGVIPAENNNYHYETIDEKTFVVVDGYVWTDYANEALDILERDKEKGQSMEIRIDEGKWDLDNGWYAVNKYRYTGVTILGDNVTPAMTNAKVKLIDEDTSNFSTNVTKMVEELNQYLTKNYNSIKEVNQVLVEEKIDVEKVEKETFDAPADTEVVIEQESLDGAEVEVTATEPNTIEVIVKAVVVDTETEVVPDIEVEVTPENFEANTTKIVFELSHDDIREKIWNILNQDDSYDYWIVEVFGDYFIASEWRTDRYWKYTYGTNEDDTITLGEKRVAVELTWTETTAVAVIKDETVVEHTSMDSMMSAEEKAELESLRTFKLDVERKQKLEMIEKFADLGEEDIKEIKEKIDTFSTTSLETELFALLGKKVKTGNFSVEKSNKLMFSLMNTNIQTNSNVPFADMVERYKAKQN